VGRYLELGNPGVEEIIDGIIDEIVHSLHPKSIILSGSFGRNEVSFIEDVGELKFLSDCEITTVCNRYISSGALKRLSLDISQRTGLEIVLHNSIKLLLYSWFRVPSWISSRLWRPSIVNYERGCGAKVVFGENILAKMPGIESGDIPLWEGIKLMFNRMAESLKYSPVDGQERDESIYWINKVIFACQDALLLSFKQYHHSYKTRNLRFQQIFPNHFSELNERLPEFLPLALKATDYKLGARKDAYPEDLRQLWFDAAKICGTVFRYIINRDMDITFDTYVEFQERYLRHPQVRGNYYLGVISSPTFHNIITAVRMIATDSCRFPSPQLIVKFGTPWRHIIYSLIPLVYFGLPERGDADGLYLKQARDTISLFIKLKPQNQNPVEEWRYVKEQVLELWRALCC